jgi:hypothetical protein
LIGAVDGFSPFYQDEIIVKYAFTYIFIACFYFSKL